MTIMHPLHEIDAGENTLRWTLISKFISCSWTFFYLSFWHFQLGLRLLGSLINYGQYYWFSIFDVILYLDIKFQKMEALQLASDILTRWHHSTRWSSIIWKEMHRGSLLLHILWATIAPCIIWHIQLYLSLFVEGCRYKNVVGQTLMKRLMISTAPCRFE